MKQAATIFFLSIYLLSATQVSELFKLPKLFEHYKMHSQWDEKMTLWGFIVKHYTEDNTRDADYQEDMKLPFKTVNNLSQAISPFYPLTPTFKIVKRENTVQCVRRPTKGIFFYSSSYLSNIWQPPKIS